jgi:hypothetical protein
MKENMVAIIWVPKALTMGYWTWPRRGPKCERRWCYRAPEVSRHAINDAEYSSIKPAHK